MWACFLWMCIASYGAQPSEIGWLRHWMQTNTRSYLCLRVKGNIVTSPEKDDWLQQTRLRIATAENGSIWRYFSIFSLQGMNEIYCHASVFLIRPTPTHNNTLQVILKISIFWFADPSLGWEWANSCID